mgnify:CR=1 FL=1
MITLQKINQLLKEFSSLHLQINSYYFGDITKNRQTDVVYPFLIANPSNVVTSYNSTTYTIYIWVLDRFQNGFVNEADVYNDTSMILQDLKAYFQNNDVTDIILEEEVTFERVSDEINSDLVGGWVGVFRIRVPFSDDLCTIPGATGGISYQDSARVITVSNGTSGTSGSSGTSGTSGPAGQNGVSNSLYYYQSKTNSTSGDPGSGHILWNNSTQSAATQINISDLTDLNVTDINIFLSNLIVGQKFYIQDRKFSSDYQQWVITGTPTKVGSYYTIPCSLVSVGGSSQFSNNEDLMVAIAAVAGTSGTSGSSGYNGNDGAVSTRFYFSKTPVTVIPPGQCFTANVDTFFGITTLRFSNLNIYNNYTTAFFNEIISAIGEGRKVYITIQSLSNPSNFGTYIVDSINNAPTYTEITTLGVVTQSGQLDGGLTFSILFSVSGINGSSGTSGSGGGGGGGSAIELPQVNVRIYKFDDTTKQNPLKIYFFPTSDNNEFLNHQPQIWMFKLIPKRKKRFYNNQLQGYEYKVRPMHWGHPSSTNQGQRPMVYNDYGQLIYAGNAHYKTEWEIPQGQMAFQHINTFDFDALNFWPASDPTQYPTGLMHPTGSKGKIRSLLFFFRIVMPDPSNSGKLLMGPPSQVIRACNLQNGANSLGITLTEYNYSIRR